MSSDSTHFVVEVVIEISVLLNITWKLHAPNRLQSSEKVERMNEMLKTQLSKYVKRPVWTPLGFCI